MWIEKRGGDAMNDQAKPWFVLGAGFNVSAASEAWASQNNSQPGLAYPLVSDLWEICFPGKPRQLDRSIEEAFAEALRSANQQPVLDLCQHLFRCDYYIAGALRDGQNCYRDFLQRFHGSDFLTYNYDSLVEILLVRLGAWSPVDGYGITVQVGRDPVAIPPPVGRSLSKVFHLHGSLVLHTETATYTRSERGAIAWRNELTTPRVDFDPSSLGGLFWPYSATRRTARERRPERVAPPVPDKSEFLTGAFAEMTLPVACDAVAGAKTLVAIGYSFSEHDQASYRPILERFSRGGGRRLVIVSPDATQVAGCLQKTIGINVEPIPLGLAAWVSARYPGI